MVIAEKLAAVDANPRERCTVLSFDQISDHRRVYCRYYDLCLEAAEWARWTSFTCVECTVVEDISPEQKRIEAADICRTLQSEKVFR